MTDDRVVIKSQANKGSIEINIHAYDAVTPSGFKYEWFHSDITDEQLSVFMKSFRALIGEVFYNPDDCNGCG